jgi:hypothetical protein
MARPPGSDGWVGFELTTPGSKVRVPSAQALAHPVRRAEPLMGPRRLLRIVGRRVIHLKHWHI